MFTWFKRRRRRKLLANPFPETWEAVLQENVYHVAYLADPLQQRVREVTRVLVAEKNWEGCGGLRMTEEVQVTVAAQIALMVLGFAEEYFDPIQSILVYPDAYVAPSRTELTNGLVLEGNDPRLGEAWYGGPVILSWNAALAAGRFESGADNLVIHEFAHQLDMQNGRTADGVPLLEANQVGPWHRVMHRERTHLRWACGRNRPTLLSCYGSTSPGEFFAVASECFFQQPEVLQEQHGDLYKQLAGYYRVDPAAWFGS